MLGTLLKLGKKLVLNKEQKPSPARITAVVVAGAGVVGAVLVSSGVSPELSQAIEEFVRAIGLLAIE